MTFRVETRHLLEEALSELDEKEGDVLGLYYFEELNMKDIGMILGVGESRVSQIHAAALVHLRSLLVPFQPRCQEPASATPANAGDVTPIEWPGQFLGSMTCVRSNACADPALTKRKEALRFTGKTELCWPLQTAHVILEPDLSGWKTGNFKQLKLFVRYESDWAVCRALQYRTRARCSSGRARTRSRSRRTWQKTRPGHTYWTHAKPGTFPLWNNLPITAHAWP